MIKLQILKYQRTEFHKFFWAFNCCSYNPLSFDPLSFDPVSFDPMSFDPVSFDPMSVNHGFYEIFEFRIFARKNFALFIFAKKCIFSLNVSFAGNPRCIHETRKLTSGASWFAEWSPWQLLANQNRLRASCYVWQAAQLCLTSNNSISNNKYLAFASTKSLFFQKISTCS